MTEPSMALDFVERPEAEMIDRARRFYEMARTRRSVRDFDDRPVPRAVIEYALLTAGTAPSGANRQPWRFVVITDRRMKKRIRQACEQVERQFYQKRASKKWLDDLAPLGTDWHKPFLESAGCLIAVFFKKFLVDEHGVKQPVYFPVESVGLACGLLITALHHAGLCCLTYTPSPMTFLGPLLGRPDEERPFCLLAVGYPAPGVRVPALSRLPLERIARFLGP